MQDTQVLQIGLGIVIGQQRIVGAAELQAGEQRFAEHVAAKGTGLAHQGMDDVPVIDPVPLSANESLHDRHRRALVIEFHDVGVRPYAQSATDQTRGHRVGTVDDAHRAGARDRGIELLVRGQRPGRERAQLPAFLLDALMAARIAGRHTRVQKRHVQLAGRELA